jgi:hypothetical protein
VRTPKARVEAGITPGAEPLRRAMRPRPGVLSRARLQRVLTRLRGETFLRSAFVNHWLSSLASSDSEAEGSK